MVQWKMHDFQAWATFITAVAALFAAVAVLLQLRFARFSAGVHLLVKLEGDFEKPEFRERRKSAALAIGSKDLSDVEDVLDFFETVGLLTRRRALDKEMVWSSFFYWIHGYCKFARDFIQRQREDYPTRYTDLVWLYKQVVAIEKKKHGTLDEREWENFLEEEKEQKRPQLIS